MIYGLENLTLWQRLNSFVHQQTLTNIQASLLTVFPYYF